MSGAISISIPNPHPGQLVVLDHPARFKMVKSGRRWGKSTCGVHWLLKKALNGKKTAWFAPSNKYVLEIWRNFVRRLRPLAEMEGGRISEQEKRIELPNGGVVEFWSLHDQEDPARGRDYDGVVVDEAGLVGSLELIWSAAIEPTLLDRNGEAMFLGTPKGSRTPFSVMFAEAEQGNDPEWAAFRGATWDNVTLKDIRAKVERALARAERRGTLALARQELFGEEADDGSNPIGLNAIRDAVSDASQRPTVAYGIDLARAVDFTVVIGFDALGRWTEFHRFQHDWRATKQRIMGICGSTIPVTIDATGVGSPIVQDLQYAGVNVTPFVFSRKTRGLLIEDLIAAFHGKRLTIPDGVCRAELESLGSEYNSETNFLRYQVPDGMHDDCIMALALAWRCYQYEAETPDWRDQVLERPWAPDKDGAVLLTQAREDELTDDFSALGAGW